MLVLTKRITAGLCQINALKFEKRLFTNYLQQLEFATYCQIEKTKSKENIQTSHDRKRTTKA